MTDFPTAYITGMTRALRSAVLATESPFRFVQQVQDTGGERWEFSIDVMAQSLGFEAFANAVINKRKPFYLNPADSKRVLPAGVAPYVHSAIGGRSYIEVYANWSGYVMRPGDFLSVFYNGRDRLHQMVSVGAADAGIVRVDIVPNLRETLPWGAAVELALPKVTLRATHNAPAAIGHVIHQFSIEAVEVL